MPPCTIERWWPGASMVLCGAVLGAGVLWLGFGGTLAPVAGARPALSARLRARFLPDRSGASTTVSFSLLLHAPGGEPPPPLADVDIHLPAGMSLFESQLGFATCSEATLLARGPGACPPNSQLGSGSAVAQLVLGSTVQEARARVFAFLGDASGAGLPVLIVAEVIKPVFAVLVFPSRLRGDSGRFGEQLDTPLPPIPTLVGAPDASIASLDVSFGPRGLTYRRREHGRLVAFHPRGLSVPRTCPRGGFPLEATLRFAGGEQARAPSRVRCPLGRGRTPARAPHRRRRPLPGRGRSAIVTSATRPARQRGMAG